MGDRRPPIPVERISSALRPDKTSNGPGQPTAVSRLTPDPKLVIPGVHTHTLAHFANGGRTPFTRPPPRNGVTTRPGILTLSTPGTELSTDSRIHRTRPPPNSGIPTTGVVTYSSRTTDTNGTTTKEFVSSEVKTPVILGATIGGVGLIVILAILILFLICRKRSRHDDGKRSLCCWASSGGNRTTSNVINNPVQPEMTRQQPYPSGTVGSRLGPHSYDGASFRQEDDSSHFYETVPSRSTPNRSSGYNHLNLPRMSPKDGETTGLADHEYLELVESNGDYNHITNPSPTGTNDLYNHSGNKRENNYDVLQNENSLRNVTAISDKQRTPVSEAIGNDTDTARLSKESTHHKHYHILDLDPS